jgi:hypothetical protein
MGDRNARAKPFDHIAIRMRRVLLVLGAKTRLRVSRFNSSIAAALSRSGCGNSPTGRC